jgi:hypothetical protein
MRALLNFVAVPARSGLFLRFALLFLLYHSPTLPFPFVVAVAILFPGRGFGRAETQRGGGRVE